MKKFEELIDISLDQASLHLQKAINYGDYLAEQKKDKQLDILNKKEILRGKLIEAKADKTVCSGSDANTRLEQAEMFAKSELKTYEQTKIESDYISDLFKNNHDRVEALRSIMSSKKQSLENFNRNSIN